MTILYSLIALFVVITIFELILYVRWNSLYFRTGLVLFRDEAEASAAQSDLPATEDLERRLEDPKWPPILFRAVGTDEMVFREAAWGHFNRASYTPLMRGTVFYDRTEAKVIVRGRLMYFSLAFFVAFVVGTYAMDALLLSLALVALYAWLYRIQVGRFEKVARLAATAWSSSVIQAS